MVAMSSEASLMLVDYRDFRFLISIADSGSFRRAAESLRVEVSTISRRIACLEDELGITMFDRDNAGARTTSAGKEVVRLARRALLDLESIRFQAAQSGNAYLGELRLATQASTLGPKLRAALSMWRHLHPKVMIELIETDDREMLSALRERRADAGVLFTPTLSARVASVELWYEKLLLAVSTRHPLSNLRSIRWQQVRTGTLLV